MKLSNQVLTTLSGLTLLLTSSINAFDVEYPEYRFRPFSELSKKQKKAAKDLGYTEASWDTPLTADVEYSAWYIHQGYYDDYETYYPKRDFDASAAKLGFVDTEDNTAEDIWDCWQNHYYSYDWAELVEYDLDSYASALGWTETTWDAEDLADDDTPESETKFYGELSNEEKTGALGLCYTQKIWDYTSLPFCMDSPQPHKNGKTCDWVSEDVSRCTGGWPKHCSNTCGSCDTSGCEDSPFKFYWSTNAKGKVLFKNCKWVLKKKKCKPSKSKLTCPQGCGLEGCVSS